MATVKVQATFCTGGGHAEVTLTVNGNAQGTWPMAYDELNDIPDDANKEVFAKNFVRLHALGKSDSTIKTNLTNGITVTI